MSIDYKKFEEKFKKASTEPNFSLSEFFKEMAEEMNLDIVSEIYSSLKDFQSKRFVFDDNIEIRIYNDGKEKHQSFEASIDFAKYGLDFVDIEVGYGYTQEDAIIDFISKFNTYNQNHLNLSTYIHENKYVPVMVDFQGNKINAT